MATSTSQSTSSQYTRPEYLQPIGTAAVESGKPSPLTLLAQACSNIGRGGTPPRTVKHADTNGNVPTRPGYQPSSANWKSSPSTSPAGNFRSGRRESSRIGSCCNGGKCTEYDRLDIDGTSGQPAVSDKRRRSATSAVDEGDSSRRRKISKPEVSGCDDDMSAEMEFDSPHSSRSKESASVEGVRRGTAELGRRDNERSLSDSSLAHRSSTESAQTSKFINGSCSPRSTRQRCGRPLNDETMRLFQTISTERRDVNVSDELFSRTAAASAAFKSSAAIRHYGSILNNSPNRGNPPGSATASEFHPYDTSAGNFAPGYGNDFISHFMSSSPSSLSPFFQNILSRTLSSNPPYPPMSSLLSPSHPKTGSIQSSLPGADVFHALLQQAMSLVHFQHWSQQCEASTPKMLSLDTAATDQCATQSSSSYQQHLGTFCTESNCRAYHDIANGAISGSSSVAMKTIGKRSNSISGCYCRPSSAVTEPQSSSPTFSSTFGSPIDRECRRLPFSSMSESSSISNPHFTPTFCQSNDYSDTTTDSGYADRQHHHVCSWLNTDEGNFCGRRFASVDSLLHHLQSHCADLQQTVTSSTSNAAASLLVARHTASTAVPQPTGSEIPPSSSSSAPSLFSSDLFNVLHIPTRIDSYRSALESNYPSLPSRYKSYNPYQMTSPFESVRTTSSRHGHASTKSKHKPSSPSVQYVGLESTMPRSSGTRHHLFNQHRSLGGAVIAGSTAMIL